MCKGILQYYKMLIFIYKERLYFPVWVLSKLNGGDKAFYGVEIMEYCIVSVVIQWYQSRNHYLIGYNLYLLPEWFWFENLDP